MPSSTDRPEVSNLFRPSLLAWRAKHLAEKKAAQANKSEQSPPKPPVQAPTQSR